MRWRKPHLRTPGYIYGLVGEVERDCQVCFLHLLTALPAEVDGELDTFECSPTFFSNTPGLLRAARTPALQGPELAAVCSKEDR